MKVSSIKLSPIEVKLYCARVGNALCKCVCALGVDSPVK